MRLFMTIIEILITIVIPSDTNISKSNMKTTYKLGWKAESIKIKYPGPIHLMNMKPTMNMHHM